VGDSATGLIAAIIIVPIAGLLIYAAFRNVVASAKNVKAATEADPNPRAKRQAIDPASMVAEFQAQAKRSDDAHKARIRAHVERKVPPLSEDGRKTIERARGARIAIKHIFPPRIPQRSMSYLGGLPIVPEDFDWPTLHNRQGLLERLTFMAQVDCADLPAGPARDLFPDRGYLYFFAPMTDTFGPDAAHFVVRHEPRRVTQKWEPLDVSLTGEIVSDDPMDAIWRGKRTHYDRIEIEFGWIAEPGDDEVAARSNEGHAFQVAEKIRAERQDAFYGPVPAASSLLSVQQAPKDALWIPYDGFPINWKTVRILRKFVEAYHREEAEDVANRQSQSKMAEVFRPALNVGAKDYDAPPAEVKTQILAFLEDVRMNGMPSSKERTYPHLRLPLVLKQWLAAAATHGAEGALTDPDGAALVPDDVIAALAHRHTARKHQMLGEGEVVQVAADEMKDRYVLLFQLGPDKALDWTRGEMGPLQYWITPEDLAAKRFENTVLTIEAY